MMRTNYKQRVHSQKESKIILFNKPFNVLSQFTDQENRLTLKNFISELGVYPAGRLDRDSEGLLILTNDGKIQHQVSHPKYKKQKVYWVQVEGVPSLFQIEQLKKGILLNNIIFDSF